VANRAGRLHARNRNWAAYCRPAYKHARCGPHDCVHVLLA